MDEKLKIKKYQFQTEYILNGGFVRKKVFRSASKKIDDEQFEENYAVRDKQDVLAMCALQFASQVEQKQIDNSINGEETIERIKKMRFRSISRQLKRSLQKLRYCLH
jgi:cell division protein ZapA